MIFCCLSVGCLPAVYLTCTFTKHLVPPPYLTLYFISAKWGRKELNLQRLPRGNGFTVRRNTANRCRFPEMRRHLTPYLCMRLRYAYSIRSARTIGTEGFEPSIRLSLLFSVYTPLLPIKLRPETAIRRLAIIFFVPCVALSMRYHGK